MIFIGVVIKKAVSGKKYAVTLTRHISGAPSRRVHIDMLAVMFTQFFTKMASLAFVSNSFLTLKPLPMWILNLNVFVLTVLYLLKKLALAEQL